MANLIFLAGAPSTTSLTWSESDLLRSFDKSVKRFLGSNSPSSSPPSTTNPSTSASSFTPPKWRSFPLNTRNNDINANPTNTPPEETQFLTFNNKPNEPDPIFLTHCLARLTALSSSQLHPFDETTTTESPNTTFLSTQPSTTFLSTQASDPHPPTAPLPPNVPLTNLSHIPSAPYIQALNPQTLTLNLLTAIIALPTPRTITPRYKGARPMEIHELLVGDDTKAGFRITFWLPACDASATEQKSGYSAPAYGERGHMENSDDVHLRQQLGLLRPGDIVVLVNVALSVWNGAAYGQSLRRRVERNSSRIFRVREEEGVGRGLGLGGGEGTAEFGVRLERVREWRDGFVGRKEGAREEGSEEAGAAWLPPDTQT
ncbi:hypothetical protein B0A50_00094 [Salinomyces thailandicus]|uniref:Uncharacterized protein n=1 Tax=Salinomyces thailandicus TaxID=706561 RepID=A0A4U0UF96_9PEZI|nr:hypothetical protein B0A50_00094 [Salinomyces thailandica]